MNFLDPQDLNLQWVETRRTRRQTKKANKQKSYTLAALSKLWNVSEETILLTAREIGLIVNEKEEKE